MTATQVIALFGGGVVVGALAVIGVVMWHFRDIM